MAGFEPGSSRIGSDHAVECTSTTAYLIQLEGDFEVKNKS